MTISEFFVGRSAQVYWKLWTKLFFSWKKSWIYLAKSSVFLDWKYSEDLRLRKFEEFFPRHVQSEGSKFEDLPLDYENNPVKTLMITCWYISSKGCHLEVAVKINTNTKELLFATTRFSSKQGFPGV